VQADCTKFLERVRVGMPRFTVRALVDGHETARVRVRVDGVEVTSTLSGRPLAVDPGERTIEVDFAERGVRRETIVFRQGEGLRELTIEALALPRPSPPPLASVLVPTTPRAETPRRRSPLLAPVMVGVAAVGLGSFAFFGLSGLSRESDLEQRCGPPCTPDDLAPLKREYAIADVSLGVAAIAGALAVWLFATR
jgi:hypothetical protein